jgi:hypothetical protein
LGCNPAANSSTAARPSRPYRRFEEVLTFMYTAIRGFLVYAKVAKH